MPLIPLARLHKVRHRLVKCTNSLKSWFPTCVCLIDTSWASILSLCRDLTLIRRENNKYLTIRLNSSLMTRVRSSIIRCMVLTCKAIAWLPLSAQRNPKELTLPPTQWRFRTICRLKIYPNLMKWLSSLSSKISYLIELPVKGHTRQKTIITSAECTYRT